MAAMNELLGCQRHLNGGFGKLMVQNMAIRKRIDELDPHLDDLDLIDDSDEPSTCFGLC